MIYALDQNVQALAEAFGADIKALEQAIPSAVNTLATEPPVIMRVFPSSTGSESLYMRVWIPTGGQTYANLLLKRGSISTSPADAGVSQATWEPDQAEAMTDAMMTFTSSTNVTGAWTTTTVGGGYWVHESGSADAARSWDFTGPRVRFGYWESSGSASFEIEVDGVVVATIPAGAATGRRVWEMSGLTPGAHTLIARRTGGGTIQVQGLVIADSRGTMEGTGTMVSEVSSGSTLLAGGVQTLVMTVDGGKRMGGGHGGSWLTAPTRVTMDGGAIAVEDTAGGYYAGSRLEIVESFELRETQIASPTAIVSRRMTFDAGQYTCDMDVRLPVGGVVLRDLFWGMAKAGTALTHVSQPVDQSLATAPIDTILDRVVMTGGAMSVAVDSEAYLNPPTPDPYTSIRDNEGIGKLYSIGSLATARTFAGRQRLRYTTRLATGG